MDNSNNNSNIQLVTLAQASEMEEIWFKRAEKLDKLSSKRTTYHYDRNRAIMMAIRLKMRCTFIMETTIQKKSIKLSDIFTYEKTNPLPVRSNLRTSDPVN